VATAEECFFVNDAISYCMNEKFQIARVKYVLSADEDDDWFYVLANRY
jgi:hypothetical protein